MSKNCFIIDHVSSEKFESCPQRPADLKECPTLKAGAFFIWERGELVRQSGQMENSRHDSALGILLDLSRPTRGSAELIPLSPQVNYPQEVAIKCNFGYRITMESLQVIDPGGFLVRTLLKIKKYSIFPFNLLTLPYYTLLIKYKCFIVGIVSSDAKWFTLPPGK